ncbi:hypothetical protein Q4489_09070 [Thalassotalea sp. 1_MG-2023]|uniref:hypothetical protein n=1 Tax=Thalassotalea sp. 1_MG-2023 TaxID=3062680 RepID=UPI0026E1C094|nr:hypothetical protein [Thalassotalea sp. 1_MG-2023]MDO6427162.1 hypothetical protein [Thalassotalea sp. 1_MG-2023]
MKNEKQQTNMDGLMHQVGYREGYHFYFTFDEQHIHVHCSALSGKESIYVNEELVITQRSLGLKSCQTLTIANKTVEIEITMAKILTGEVHCTLIVDNTHVATQKQVLKKRYQLNDKTLLPWMLLFGLLGAVLGYLSVDIFNQLFL